MSEFEHVVLDVDRDLFLIDNGLTYMAPFSSSRSETDMTHALESSLLMGVSHRMNADWIVCALRWRALWFERNMRRKLSIRHSKTLLIESANLPVNDNFFALQTMVVWTRELAWYDDVCMLLNCFIVSLLLILIDLN